MLPFFKKGDFAAARWRDGAGAARRSAASRRTWIRFRRPRGQQSSHGGGIPIFFIVLILWIVFGKFFWPLLFLAASGGGRGGWGGGFGGGGFGGGGFGGGGFPAAAVPVAAAGASGGW